MSPHLGQLIYTSFTSAGLKTLVSPSVPAEVQQAFLQAVVHQYWNAYRPPQPGFQAVYLYQIAAEKTLFGWVYDDGVDDLGRSHVPYFLCYYLEEPLQANSLNHICDCLEQGPVVFYDRQQLPINLEYVSLPESSYAAAAAGVKIPASLRLRSHEELQQDRLLDWFVSTEGAEIGPALPPALAPEPQPVMTKAALLIGTSDCAADFTALPGVQKDVAALQQVLAAPEIGNFDQVQTLINPDRQTMAEAIERLFAERQETDLVLLYFSGHALQDETGHIYWSTGISRRKAQNQPVRSTVIAASFIQDVMDHCPAQQQVVILDCCWNDGMTRSPATNQWLNLKQQFSGQERILLTAANSTCSPIHQKGSDLSVYTFYLVEGLKTGAADFDGDGIISLLEWHEYARHKVQAATPALHPQLYGHLGEQTYGIAKATLEDPQLRYRKGVESCVGQGGKITLVNRTVLDALQESLGLTAEAAAAIEAAVLRPHQTYQKRLQVYAQRFLDAIQQSFPLTEETDYRFQQLRLQLGLTEENTGPLEVQLTRQLKVVHAPQPAPALIRSPAAAPAPTGFLMRNPLVRAATTAQVLIPALGHSALAFGQSLHRFRPPKPAAFLPQSVSRYSWLRLGAVVASVLLAVGVVSAVRRQQAQQDSQQLQAVAALTTQRNYEACLSRWQQMPNRTQTQPKAQQYREVCEAGLNWQNSQSQILQGHQGPVWTVALSPEGQTIASAGDDRDIRLWSLNTGKLLRSLSEHFDTVWSVAISPDGQLLASGSADQTLKIWNLTTGKSLHTLFGHGATVWSVAISPDGQLLASGGGDNTIKLWNLQTGELQQTLTGHQGAVRSLAISPDGRLLASGGGDNAIKLWNLQTGELQQTLTGHQRRVIALAISPDGQLLASGGGDNTIKLWNLQTGELQRTLGKNPGAITGVAIALAETGRAAGLTPLIAGSSDNTLQLWSGTTGEVVHRFPEADDKITATAFSPDGLRLLTANQDYTLTLWQR